MKRRAQWSWNRRTKGGKSGLVDGGGRDEARGVFRQVGCQEGVKYQSVVVLCQSTVGPS